MITITSSKPGTSVGGFVSQPCQATSLRASVVRASQWLHPAAPWHAAVPSPTPSAAVQHLTQVQRPATMIPDHVSDVRQSHPLTQRLSRWPRAVVERRRSTAVSRASSAAEDVSVPDLVAESVHNKIHDNVWLGWLVKQGLTFNVPLDTF